MPDMFPDYKRRYWYTDVEPAYEKRAECECHMPPMPPQCVCVTQADVDNWNASFSAVAAIIESGYHIDDISVVNSLVESSANWDATYNIVSTYSANWSSVSALSADFIQFKDDVSAAMSDVAENAKVYADQSTIVGTGKQNDPFRVAYSEQIDQIIATFEEELKKAGDLTGLAQKFDECKSSVMTYIQILSAGHDNNYKLIRSIIEHGADGKTVYWKYTPTMDMTDPATYSDYIEDNTIYYSTYEGEE